MKKLAIAGAMAFGIMAGASAFAQSVGGTIDAAVKAAESAVKTADATVKAASGKVSATATAVAADEVEIRKTAIGFSESLIRDGNIDAATQYMSTTTAQLFDMLISLGGEDAKKELASNARKTAKFTVKSVEVTGDKAKAIVTGVVDGETSDETFDLVKENGVWKVNVEKENS